MFNCFSVRISPKDVVFVLPKCNVLVFLLFGLTKFMKRTTDIGKGFAIDEMISFRRRWWEVLLFQICEKSMNCYRMWILRGFYWLFICFYLVVIGRWRNFAGIKISYVCAPPLDVMLMDGAFYSLFLFISTDFSLECIFPINKDICKEGKM